MKSNRRQFIQTMGAGTAGLTPGTSEILLTSCSSTSVIKEDEDDQILFIGDNIATADAKIKQPAPVYLAWFGWNPPLFDGRLRAFHTMDIGFWLYNTDVQISHTGGGAQPRKLAEKMSDALLQFMKTGNPNGGGLPKWSKYTTANGETMILDDVCELKNDPDREARKSL